MSYVQTDKKSTLDDILNQLRDVDWEFQKFSSNGHVTSLHPYPARFIPSIPSAIIDALKPHYNNLNILDPFAGCGTVLAEGLAHGCSVTGIDVNGLANFLQRVCTSKILPYHLEELELVITQITENAHRYQETNLEIIDIPNIQHWFEEDSITLISDAIKVANKVKTEEVRLLALLSISRSLVNLSKQKSDTQYVAVEKNQNKDDKLKVLINSFKTVRSYYTKNSVTQLGVSRCILGDSRDPESYRNIVKVNLVITSPPYPNAYEYWLYHKYRMYWLGMDPIWSRTNEIGVRPHYSGSGKKDEWDFYKDILQVLTNIDAVTTEDALQFWVVGDSIIKGRAIDNTKIIVDAAKEIGWKNVATYQRPINRKRSSFQGIGKKLHEDIIVLSR